MPNDTILAHPVSEQEILAKIKEFRRVGADASFDQYDRMIEADNFVIGRHWDEAVRAQAEIDHKFTLTINITKPQINQISGSEIQNPQDFIIENTQGGAATIARVLTALVKQVADSEQTKYEKSGMFKGGISSGQGCIGVFIDKTEDPLHANLEIKKLNEHNVLFDPNAESYNQNTKGTGGQYIIWDEPVPKEELEAEYPDKKDELVAGGSAPAFGFGLGNIKAIIRWQVGRRGRNADNFSFGSRPRAGHDNFNKTRYWKTHTFWKEYKTCVQWFDNRESELESKFLCRDKDIAAVKKITKEQEDIAKIRVAAMVAQLTEKGADLENEEIKQAIEEAGTPVFRIVEVNSFIMHHTISARDTFLEDRVDELNGVQMFPIVPYWPYHINGFKSGVAEDLIGVQKEINWSRSMTLNQVKQMSYPPVVIGEDASGDKADELRTKLQGGKRAIINKGDYGDFIEFVKQPEIPTTEFITQTALNNVKTITGRLDIPETNQKSLSGKAKIVDVQKTKQGSETIFSNYNHTLAILGNLIVDIIRKNDIFSEDEIRAVVDSEDLIDGEILNQAKGIVIRQIQQQGGQIPQQPEPPNPIRTRNAPPELQAQILEKFQQEMKEFEQFVNQVEQAAIPIAEKILIDMIHQMKIGKYNTKMTMSPMAETMRLIKTIEIFKLQEILRTSGDVGLDGDDLIEATDVPNKEKLRQGRAKLIANISGANAPAA